MPSRGFPKPFLMLILQVKFHARERSKCSKAIYYPYRLVFPKHVPSQVRHKARSHIMDENAGACKVFLRGTKVPFLPSILFLLLLLL